MRFGVRSGSAIDRSGDTLAEPVGSPSIDPWTAEPADACTDNEFPEIDCVRPLLAADVLDSAQQRAAALGIGADRVLIAAGLMNDETYLRALAAWLGVAFEPLDGVLRALCPVDDERLIESGAAGLLPLTVGDDLCLVVAPRGVAARQIIGMIEANPAQALRFRFTSAECLNHFVMRCAGKALAARASNQIKQTWPLLSAAASRRPGRFVPVAIIALLSLAFAVWAPDAAMLALEVTLAALFLAWLGLRLAGVFVAPPASNTSQRLSDDALPVYSVIAALYREVGSVDGLLSAIERLDYPGIMAQPPQDRRRWVHPLFMAELIYSVMSGAPMWRGDSASTAILATLYGTVVVIGYLISAFLGWLGLSRRGLLSTAWVLVLTPAHWLLLSLAAWRAVYQLIVAPYAWEKTEHGLAKSSRRAANMTRSLVELER